MPGTEVHNSFEVRKLMKGIPCLFHAGSSQFWVVNGKGNLAGRRRTISQHKHGWIAQAGIGFKTADGTSYPKGTKYVKRPESGSKEVQLVYREGDTELFPYPTFDQAAEVAMEMFGTSRWKRPNGTHFGTHWYPVDAPEPDVRTRSGTKIKWTEGKPCQHAETNMRYSGCTRFVDRDGLCKIHANATEKSQASSARHKASMDEMFERSRREKEAAQAAREILDEISPLLSSMGHRPDLFTVKGGNIASPAEGLREIVRLAALAWEVGLND